MCLQRKAPKRRALSAWRCAQLSKLFIPNEALLEVSELWTTIVKKCRLREVFRMLLNESLITALNWPNAKKEIN